MNVDKLARVVGLEWWRQELNQFGRKGYSDSNLATVAMKDQLMQVIERIVRKTTIHFGKVTISRGRAKLSVAEG